MAPPSSSGHRHRSGSLRQSNKRHKIRGSGLQRSKRAQQRHAGAGKIFVGASGSVRGGSVKSAGSRHSLKAERVHRSHQRRDAARKRRVMASRLGSGGGKYETPKTIGIVSLSSSVGGTGKAGALEESVRRYLMDRCSSLYHSNLQGESSTKEKEGPVESTAGGGSSSTSSYYSSVTCRYDAHKCNLTLLTNTSAFYPQNKKNAVLVGEDDDGSEDATIASALDLCRVCDSVLFLLDGTPLLRGGGGNNAAERNKNNVEDVYSAMVSSCGERILTACKSQGLPTPLTVMLWNEGEVGGPSAKNAKKSAVKRRNDAKRYGQRFATTEFGEGAKFLDVELPFLYKGAEEGEQEEEEEEAMEEEEDVGEGTTTVAAVPASSKQSSTLVRTLCTMSTSPAKWTVMRSHLVTDGHHGNNGGHWYDDTTKELTLIGYLRGDPPFHVNSLAHVPHLGTYQVKDVRRSTPPKYVVTHVVASDGGVASSGATAAVSTTSAATVGDVLVKSDPGERESLDQFAVPDALMGEQNLIGFDEGEEEGGDGMSTSDKTGDDSGKLRPAGWSDYQAAWLDAIDDDVQSLAAASESGAGGLDHGELAKQLNAKTTNSSVMGFDDDDMEVTAEERRLLALERKKQVREDLDFPDEVEIDPDGDVTARDRFARYRSLKSFRKSYWDAKENLPETYATLFHFANFRATQRDVRRDVEELVEEANKARWEEGWLAGDRSGTRKVSSKEKKNENEGDDDDVAMADDDGNVVAKDEEDDEDEEDPLDGCVASGTYVAITLEGVPSAAYQSLAPAAPLAAVNLLPHEHKVSVLHMGVSQTATCDIRPSPSSQQQATTSPGESTGEEAEGGPDLPVKSKDVLTFRCGWRTWRGRPIFSQNNLNSDKHKFERFLPSRGAFVAASVMGPVTYSPCPVMIFREPVPTKQDADMVDGGEETPSKPKQSHQRQLVALGGMLGADADRIVIKRIVLTGFPTRVHKRNATVKYMFYNPDDVRWFKPAGLTTKQGLQGHILDSVGDHGTMKCLFNQPIKQHDTVCLPLYKRVYPKYAPTKVVGNEEDHKDEDGTTAGGAISTKDLIVL